MSDFAKRAAAALINANLLVPRQCLDEAAAIIDREAGTDDVARACSTLLIHIANSPGAKVFTRTAYDVGTRDPAALFLVVLAKPAEIQLAAEKLRDGLAAAGLMEAAGGGQ